MKIIVFLSDFDHTSLGSITSNCVEPQTRDVYNSATKMVVDVDLHSMIIISSQVTMNKLKITLSVMGILDESFEKMLPTLAPFIRS